MGMLLDERNQPTNMLLAVMLVVILILTLFSTIFSGVGMKKAFEGAEYNPGADTYIAPGFSMARGVGLVSRSDGPYGYDKLTGFLGRPEAPVFYQIGDTELQRANQVSDYTLIPILDKDGKPTGRYQKVLAAHVDKSGMGPELNLKKEKFTDADDPRRWTKLGFTDKELLY